MKDFTPRFQDDMELRLTKNVVHVLSGYTAELAIAVLIKTLQSLLIGVSKDKASAVKHVIAISKHLKKELNSTKADDYGYLTVDESNAPIITDKNGVRH